MKTTFKLLSMLLLTAFSSSAVAQETTDLTGLAELKAFAGGTVKLTLEEGTVVYGAVTEYSGDYLYLWDGTNGTRISMPNGTLANFADYVGKSISGSVTGSYYPTSGNGNTVLSTAVALVKGDAAELTPVTVTLGQLREDPAAYAYSYVKVIGDKFLVNGQHRLYSGNDYMELTDLHYLGFNLNPQNNRHGAFTGPFYYYSSSYYGDRMQLAVIADNWFEAEGLVTPEPVTLDATQANDLSADHLLATVTLQNASYQAGELAVFAVPFSLSAYRLQSVFGDDTKLYSLDNSKCSLSATEATFAFKEYDYSEYGSLATAIYLIKPANSVSNPVFTAVQMQANPTPGYSYYTNWAIYKSIDFKGTFTPMTLKTDGTQLVLDPSGTLTVPTTAQIDGFSGYFQVPSGVTTVKLSLPEGTVVGISEATTQPADGGSVYSLSGQKVTAPTHGVYVKNGRKVVVK